MNKIKINEDIEQELISNILCEVFYPTSDKVLYIKDYLDKKFMKQLSDDIDSNGYPIKVTSAIMISDNKQPLKSFTPSELLLFLDSDEKIRNMVTDKGDRRKFLKQVITDWYKNNISKNGMLSVNHL